MNAVANLPTTSNEIPLVEVLTDQNGTITIGYRIGGYRAGPNLVVSACDPIAQQVYDRLMQLPTLGWMRGSLTLMFSDKSAPMASTALLDKFVGPQSDDVFILPDNTYSDAAATDAYWSVLRKCTQLGMISGRGLPYPGKSEETT